VLISLGLSLQLHPLRPSSQSMAARYRSFYGVLSIYEYNRDNPAEHYFLLQHGAITHGLQYVDPLRCRTATSYYEAGSGVGLAMIKLAQEGPRHIGVVGLGTGTMAAYGRKGDRFRFYEINPQVEMIARKHFTYLSQCDAQVDVILGDARLSMEAEDAQAFDVLVLDAFSGDAIPVHLLTREAFQIYQRHMKANGVIAVHVSNQFLDLEPIVARIAEHFGLRATAVSYALADYPSDWVLVAMNPALLEGLQAEDSDISPARAKRAPLWTDDHTSLLPIVRGSAAISWP
jgi:spermidine synthase